MRSFFNATLPLLERVMPTELENAMLARADVGIAIGAGTDVAIESAGVVLASDRRKSKLVRGESASVS